MKSQSRPRYFSQQSSTSIGLVDQVLPGFDHSRLVSSAQCSVGVGTLLVGFGHSSACFVQCPAGCDRDGSSFDQPSAGFG